MRNRHVIHLLLATALVTLAAACGSSGGFGDSATDTAAEAPAVFQGDDSADFDEGFAGDFEESGEIDAALDDRAAADAEPAEAPNVVTTGSTGAPPAAQLPDLGRDIIYTADLELATTDVTAATREAIRTVEGLGGFLFSQETRGGSGGSSLLVFKVLPEQFQTTLNELGSIGSVRSQSISADDVTSVVVDLQSRITTAEASVGRLRGFLEDAEGIEAIASLENELLQRETTLEQLRGQLRSVQNQVDLATIDLTITELLNRPVLLLDAASYSGHDGGFNCPDAYRVGSVDADEPITICYRLTNEGDTDLVDLAIDDPVLGATLEDLIVVEGSIAELAPGESVTVAHEIEVDDALRLRTTASAIAVDVDGNRLDDEVQATAPRLRVDVIEDDSGLPGFAEVLRGSWNALATLGVLIALGFLAALPFVAAALVLAVLGWFVVRPIVARLRRRGGREQVEPGTASGTAEPVDPPDAPSGGEDVSVSS